MQINRPETESGDGPRPAHLPQFPKSTNSRSICGARSQSNAECHIASPNANSYSGIPLFLHVICRVLPTVTAPEAQSRNRTLFEFPTRSLIRLFRRIQPNRHSDPSPTHRCRQRALHQSNQTNRRPFTVARRNAPNYADHDQLHIQVCAKYTLHKIPLYHYLDCILQKLYGSE